MPVPKRRHSPPSLVYSERPRPSVTAAGSCSVITVGPLTEPDTETSYRGLTASRPSGREGISFRAVVLTMTLPSLLPPPPLRMDIGGSTRARISTASTAIAMPTMPPRPTRRGSGCKSLSKGPASPPGSGPSLSSFIVSASPAQPAPRCHAYAVRYHLPKRRPSTLMLGPTGLQPAAGLSPAHCSTRLFAASTRSPDAETEASFLRPPPSVAPTPADQLDRTSKGVYK